MVLYRMIKALPVTWKSMECLSRWREMIVCFSFLNQQESSFYLILSFPSSCLLTSLTTIILSQRAEGANRNAPTVVTTQTKKKLCNLEDGFVFSCLLNVLHLSRKRFRILAQKWQLILERGLRRVMVTLFLCVCVYALCFLIFSSHRNQPFVNLSLFRGSCVYDPITRQEQHKKRKEIVPSPLPALFHPSFQKKREEESDQPKGLLSQCGRRDQIHTQNWKEPETESILSLALFLIPFSLHFLLIFTLYFLLPTTARLG